MVWVFLRDHLSAVWGPAAADADQTLPYNATQAFETFQAEAEAEGAATPLVACPTQTLGLDATLYYSPKAADNPTEPGWTCQGWDSFKTGW